MIKVPINQKIKINLDSLIATRMLEVLVSESTLDAVTCLTCGVPNKNCQCGKPCGSPYCHNGMRWDKSAVHLYPCEICHPTPLTIHPLTETRRIA